MDNKTPLSQINKPIKAADWFERFDKLPKEIMVDEESSIKALEELAKTADKKKTRREGNVSRIKVKASDWLEHSKKLPNELPEDEVNDIVSSIIKNRKKKSLNIKEAIVDVESPENIDVNVTIKNQPIDSTTPLLQKQSSIDEAEAKKEEKEEKEADNLDRLVESILNLTKAIQDKTKEETVVVSKPAPPENQLNESGEPSESSNDNKRQSRRKSKKRKTASYRELARNIFKEKVEDTQNFFTVRNLLTVAGMRSAMAGSGSILDRVLETREEKIRIKKKGVKPGSGLMERITGLFNKGDINDYSTGTIVPELMSTDEKSSTNSSKGKISNTVSDILSTVTKKNEVDESVVSKSSSTIEENVIEKLGSKLPKEIQDIVKDPSSPHHEDVVAGLKEGIKDELVTLGEEQLEMLKKVVEALENQKESKEEKLENQIKSPSDLVVKKEEKKEKDKSMLQSALDKVKDFGKGKLGKLGGLLGRAGAAAAPFALPALAVAGTGAAAYGVGTMLNRPINALASKITGNKDDTLGTAIYDGVDRVKDFFGFDSDVGRARAEKEQMAKIAASRPKVSSTTANPSIEPQPEVKPPSDVYRISQVQNIQSRIKETTRLDEKKKLMNNSNPGVIDARSSVTNNSTVVQHNRPIVKNPDNTFNRLLGINFNH